MVKFIKYCIVRGCNSLWRQDVTNFNCSCCFSPVGFLRLSNLLVKWPLTVGSGFNWSSWAARNWVTIFGWISWSLTNLVPRVSLLPFSSRSCRFSWRYLRAVAWRRSRKTNLSKTMKTVLMIFLSILEQSFGKCKNCNGCKISWGCYKSFLIGDAFDTIRTKFS